jgi:tetratricopeptide (TPR) repeat protein
MRARISSGQTIDPWMEVEEARLLYEARRLPEAEILLEDYAEHHGWTGTAANLLGLIKGIQEEKEKSVEFHLIARDKQPENAILQGNYGYALADVGRDEEAEAILRSALQIDSTLRYVYVRLGDIYRKHGNETAARKEFAEALRLMERALLVKPDSPSLLNEAINLYGRLGDYQNRDLARKRWFEVSKQASQEYAEVARSEGDISRVAGPDSGFFMPHEVAGDEHG